MEWILAHPELVTFVLSTMLGFTVWLARLEGKVASNEHRIGHAEIEIESMHSGIQKELTEVKQALARIEGYLKAKAEELKS